MSRDVVVKDGMIGYQVREYKERRMSCHVAIRRFIRSYLATGTQRKNANTEFRASNARIIGNKWLVQ